MGPRRMDGCAETEPTGPSGGYGGPQKPRAHGLRRLLRRARDLRRRCPDDPEREDRRDGRADLAGAATALMVRGAAAMLPAEVSQIGLILFGVSDVSRGGVMHDEFDGLPEGRHEPVHEHQQQQDAHHDAFVMPLAGECKTPASLGVGCLAPKTE